MGSGASTSTSAAHAPTADTDTIDGPSGAMAPRPASPESPQDSDDDDKTSSESDENVPEQLTKEEGRKELDQLLQSCDGLFQEACELLQAKLEGAQDVDMERLAELIKAVISSWVKLSEEKYAKFQSAREYVEKAEGRAVRLGLVDLMCDFVAQRSEARRCREDEEDVDESEVLRHIRTTLWNLTYENSLVRRAVGSHEKFLSAVVSEMDDICTSYINGSSEASDHNTVLGYLSVINNVGFDDENLPLLRRTPKLVDVLSRFVNLDQEVWKFFAVRALACVATDTEADKLTTTSDIISYLLMFIERAFNCDDHLVKLTDSVSCHGTFLVGAVKQLSRNKLNSRLLVEKGALPLLTQGLQHSEFKDERKGCMESLWSLSFNAENQEDMMKDTKLLDLVIKVYRDDSDPCRSAAAGMLFQLREHLQKHPRKDYNDVVEQPQKGQESHPVTSGHVMLSYQTANRPVVKMVCDFLKDNGIPVWMDIYNIAEGEETTTQSMAEAVEGSVVFLMCISETYKDSLFCRQEAEYALVRRKYIIPLKLRKDYKPDGWLGIIGAGRYFFDFSREELYESKRIALLSKIRKAFNAAAKNPMGGQIVISHGASDDSSRKSGTSPSDLNKIKNWTRDNVEEWLRKFGLKGKAIQSLRGKDIAFLYQMRSQAPESFYQLLLSNDWLKKVSAMADFTFALDDVPSMLK